MAAVPRLAAAVSNAGALGMVTLTWSADAGAVVRETAALTARPFGGNLVLTEDHHRRLEAGLRRAGRRRRGWPGGTSERGFLPSGWQAACLPAWGFRWVGAGDQ